MINLFLPFLSRLLGFIKILSNSRFQSSFSSNLFFLLRCKLFLFRQNDEEKYQEFKSSCYQPCEKLGVTRQLFFHKLLRVNFRTT